MFPRDKLSLVKGIRAARFSRESVAAHFRVPVSEVASWERAFTLAQAKGWGHIKSQELPCPEPVE